MITCSELMTVNIHAKTTVSSLTANRPNTHVKPNTGSRTTAAFADALKSTCIYIVAKVTYTNIVYSYEIYILAIYEVILHNYVL